jgi:hypothetical protein
MRHSGATNGRLHEDSGTDSDDPRIVAAVQEYLAALELGKRPSRHEFLSRHGDIAGELAHCLEGLEWVHQAALDLKQENDDAPSSEYPDNPGIGNSDAVEQLPLGDFRIVREIGRGGMGVVYEAIQLSLGRRVALKVLPFVAALDPTRLQRFKNEAQAAAQLHHTNIVPVYAVGAQRGVHFYAMQLIEGQSLSALIEDARRLRYKPAPDHAHAPATAGPVPVADPPLAQGETHAPASTVRSVDPSNPTSYFRTVVALMEQAARALDHAHTCGVVHRDVKPANLLLDGRGNIWITDFGLAQFHAGSQLTRSGEMLGTLRYMSPEQIESGKGGIDHRTDIYSLGATLYELLTLEPIFAGDDRGVLLRQILEDEPTLLRGFDKRIPLELETIVLKAIAKAPAERYATAGQLADDLQRWLDDKPILARRPTIFERASRWRRRHRAVVKSAIVFLFLAMFGMLGGTLAITREHAKTKAAYQREIAQRAAAEESFRQARQAVDSFTQLSEAELADKPSMFSLRRNFLDVSLEYYRNFLQQRHNDPSVRAELAATSERVARIVDELSVLAGFGQLMLLSDERVQEELAVSAPQREKIDELVMQLWAERAQVRQGDQRNSEVQQQHLAEMLRSHEAKTSGVLTRDQARRLREIALQQQGPFALKRPEVVAALNLSPAQRKQVSEIIEANAVHRDKPGEPAGRGDPPGRPPHDGPPPRQRDPRFAEHHPDRPPPRPDERRDHEWNDSLADDLPGCAGPNDPHDDAQAFKGPGKRPPPPRGPGHPDHEFGRPPRRGPPPGEHGPMGHRDTMRERMNRTVAEIMTVLTASQRSTWQELVGLPFAHDLHYGPDDWFLW